MMNVDQITTRLSMMDDAALQKFAAMNKNDPYLLPLAISESNRRQRVRMAGQAQQAQPQPPIADAAIAQMRPAPEPDMSQMAAAGIPQLAARNIETMADGGIAGYATGGVTKEERETYRSYAIEKARQLGLDPKFVDAIFQTESGYNPNARSKTGPVGIGQLTRRTARALGLDPYERRDPYKNMDAAMSHMKDLFRKYKDPAKVAIAYNQGEGVLNEHLKQNRGQIVPERLHENVRTANKQEPVNYLNKISSYAGLPSLTAAAPTKPKPKPKREEFVGLSPEIAKQITEALPMASAQAGELPRTVDGYTRSADGRTISGPVTTAQASSKAPQAPVETGIANLPKRDKFVDPLAKQREQLAKEFTLPSGREVGSAAAATGDYLYNLLPFAAGEAGYAAGRMFGVPEESARKVPEFFAGFTDPLSRFFKTKGTAEDQAALTRKIEKFVGENIHKGAEWIAENSEKYTGAPISVRDAENLMNISALALGAKGKGKGKAEPAPTVGAAEAKTRIADAEAAAATAAENAKTAAAPRLEAPKPEVTPSRAFELQRQIFGEERAPQFTPDPAAQKFGVEAMLARKRAQQAADVRKAQEAATVAERKAAEVKALEEGRIAEMSAVPRTTTPAAPFVRPRTAMAAVAGGREPIPESYDDIVRAADLGSQDAGIPLTPPSGATPFSTPTSEEKAPAPTAAQKKAFGLDNEDLLMLGLGMLASPGGQAGGELSQLFSNFGRSGLNTVAAKREREKLAEEKDYKNIMKQYYGKLTEMYGRPELIERHIAEIRKANPGISYEEAMERAYAAQYGSRMETEMEKARLRAAGPFAGLMDNGLMGPGGDLTSEGRSVFAKYFPKV